MSNARRIHRQRPHSKAATTGVGGAWARLKRWLGIGYSRA
jgi:hypothetical protein